MNKLFLSYNQSVEQYVKEIKNAFKEKEDCYGFVFDNEQSFKTIGNISIVTNDVSDKLRDVDGLILLIGENTHSPRATLEEELAFAIKLNLPVFGVRIPGTNSQPPEKIKDYMRYFEVDFDMDSLIRQVEKELPC